MEGPRVLPGEPVSDEELLHLPAAHFKLLDREILHGKDRWLPRLFPGEHTPARELLADPLRSGILSSLLGAGLGGLAGHYGGRAVGADTLKSTLGGAGLGGVAGFGLGLAHRQNKNDEIMDKMRRLAPGATVGEMDKLGRDVSAGQAAGATLGNALGGAYLGGLVGTLMRAPGVPPPAPAGADSDRNRARQDTLEPSSLPSLVPVKQAEVSTGTLNAGGGSGSSPVTKAPATSNRLVRRSFGPSDGSTLTGKQKAAI